MNVFGNSNSRCLLVFIAVQHLTSFSLIHTVAIPPVGSTIFLGELSQAFLQLLYTRCHFGVCPQVRIDAVEHLSKYSALVWLFFHLYREVQSEGGTKADNQDEEC